MSIALPPKRTAVKSRIAERVKLPDEKEDDCVAFVSRYVENYIHARKEQIAKELDCSVIAVELDSREEDKLRRQAENNAQLLYDLAFSHTPASHAIERFLSVQQLATFVQAESSITETTIPHLQNVTHAMAAESSDKDLAYDLQRFTLDKLMHKWVDVRNAAWDDFLVEQQENFKMGGFYLATKAHDPAKAKLIAKQYPEALKWTPKKYEDWSKYFKSQEDGTAVQQINNERSVFSLLKVAGNRAFNDDVKRAFNTFCKTEEAGCLYEAIQGLCHGYLQAHIIEMKSQNISMDKRDIETIESVAFADAMRTFAFGRSNNGTQEAAFPSHLISWQHKAFNDLMKLKNLSLNPKKVKFERSIRTIDREGDDGESLAGNLADSDDSCDPSIEADRRALVSRLSELLPTLDRRSQQIIILRFGLEIPHLPSNGDEATTELQAESNTLWDEIIAIRQEIDRHRVQDDGDKNAPNSIVVPPSFAELSAFPFGEETNGGSRQCVSKERIRQIEGASIKKLIKIGREKAGMVLGDEVAEAAEIDRIFGVYWGQDKDNNGNQWKLRRLQAQSIDQAIAYWLTGDELADNKLLGKSRERLKMYRSNNPPHLLHKKSFVEMLAEGEREGKEWNDILKDICNEWSSDKGNFTLKELANYILADAKTKKITNSITQNEMESFLRDPWPNSRLREDGAEVLSAATGMSPKDEAMFWRLAHGNKRVTVNFTEPPQTIHQKLLEKSGIPTLRLYKMIGSYEDVMHNVTKRDEDRIFYTPESLTLVSYAQPSQSWLSGAENVEQWRNNWKVARKISGDLNPQLFEDMVANAIEQDDPRKALLNMIVSRKGICTTATDNLGALWKQKNPDGGYSTHHTKGLKHGEQRPLTLSEAEVILNIAQSVCLPFSAATRETCLEILTDCPTPEHLVDQYINQTDNSGKPAKILLKPILEQIARSRGKTLTANNPNERLVPESTVDFITMLKNEDRLAEIRAPLFADALGLTDERRRRFLLRAKGIPERNAEDIIDEVLGGQITAGQGVDKLIEQTGMMKKDFAEVAKVEDWVVRHWCIKGFVMDLSLANSLANALGRPTLAGKIEATFCRSKRGRTVEFEVLQEETHKSHVSRILGAIDNGIAQGRFV